MEAEVRTHLITHPVLGPVTWEKLKSHVKSLRRIENRKACSWCFGAVSKGRRTRCGSKACDEAILLLSYPNTGRRAVLREEKSCRICGVGRVNFEVDHIIPVIEGGTGDRSNLRALCPLCHRKETASLAARRAEARRK